MVGVEERCPSQLFCLCHSDLVSLLTRRFLPNRASWLRFLTPKRSIDVPAKAETMSYAWIARPSAASAASFTTSEMLG